MAIHKYIIIPFLAVVLSAGISYAGDVETTPQENQQAVKGIYQSVDELRKYLGKLPMGFCIMDKHGSNNIAIGLRAGMHLGTGSCNILIGQDTETPTPETNNFVNIGNKLCFDRVSGKRLECPKP